MAGDDKGLQSSCLFRHTPATTDNEVLFVIVTLISHFLLFV